MEDQAEVGVTREIDIRIAHADTELADATKLVNHKYSGRGYGGCHKISSAGNCATFMAYSNNSLIGTLSLTVDSRDGLSGDETFKEELDKFRNADGVKICELTKFAFDNSRSSQRLLGSFFHVIFIYGTFRHSCTDLFIEVNPRHRRFYEAMLGFKVVGTLKTNDSVGAPSYLMRLKVSDIRNYIDKNVGSDRAGSRSLYPYFFSAKEEIDIYKRLADSSLDELWASGGNRSLVAKGHISGRHRRCGESAFSNGWNVKDRQLALA
jgi:hypothetical protein